MTRPHGGIRPQGVTKPQGVPRPHGGIRRQGVTRPHGGILPHGVTRPQGGILPHGVIFHNRGQALFECAAHDSNSQKRRPKRARLTTAIVTT